MSLAFIKSDSGNLTVYVNGKSHTVSPDHANYTLLCEALKSQDESLVEKYLSLVESIQNYVSGKLTIYGEKFFYEGEPIHNVLCDHILELMRGGWPADRFIKFMENLMLNPSRKAIESLYEFLSARGFPITEDGCFLGYKGLKDDYMDIYSNTIHNHIGATISVPRRTVDDDSRFECSYGLHVGTYQYAHSYSSGGKIVLVKVNPKDVVSVPEEGTMGKIRTCEYTVIADYDSQEKFSSPAATLTQVNDKWVVSTKSETPRSYTGIFSWGNPAVKPNFHNKRDSKGRFTK
jgi:hypothetical protein